jgi:hypothetical protein
LRSFSIRAGLALSSLWQQTLHIGRSTGAAMLSQELRVPDTEWQEIVCAGEGGVGSHAHLMDSCAFITHSQVCWLMQEQECCSVNVKSAVVCSVQQWTCLCGAKSCKQAVL